MGKTYLEKWNDLVRLMENLGKCGFKVNLNRPENEKLLEMTVRLGVK